MSSPVRFALALALLATTACDEPTGPPTINWVRGPGTVFANDNIEVEGEAWDWGLAPVEFSWSCPAGSLVLLEQSRTYSKVRWLAPESSGKVAVRLLVTDLDGETARDSLAVEVRRRTAGLLDYSGEVKAGLFRQWPESLRTGYRVRGEFAVADSERLSFYLLGEDDYQRWLARDSFGWLVGLPDTPHDTFSAVVPQTGWYRLLVDNRALKADREFRLRATRTTP